MISIEEYYECIRLLNDAIRMLKYTNDTMEKKDFLLEINHIIRMIVNLEIELGQNYLGKEKK